MECHGDPRVAEFQILEVEGNTIGMVNNLALRGMNDEIRPGIIDAHRLPDQSLPVMVERVFGTAVDIVVFGRTHHALVEEHQGILFINPGSPALPKNLRKLGNVAVLELTPEGRGARVIDLTVFS